MTPARRIWSARSGQAGLTLVELLIVLFIVSLGWFALLPRLDPTGPRREHAPLHEMNEFLDQVRQEAFVSGRFQEIRVDHLQGRFTWNDSSQDLHQPVTRCTINESPCPRSETIVRVYPGGYMDHLVLLLADGKQWKASELDVRVLVSERP